MARMLLEEGVPGSGFNHGGTREMTPGDPDSRPGNEDATWGPKLFYGALLGSLVFFWWFLIYSHGVTPHGG